jgi:hypothetical protein
VKSRLILVCCWARAFSCNGPLSLVRCCRKSLALYQPLSLGPPQFDMVMDTFFMIEIVLTFFIGVHHKGPFIAWACDAASRQWTCSRPRLDSEAGAVRARKVQRFSVGGGQSLCEIGADPPRLPLQTNLAPIVHCVIGKGRAHPTGVPGNLRGMGGPQPRRDAHAMRAVAALRDTSFSTASRPFLSRISSTSRLSSGACPSACPDAKTSSSVPRRRGPYEGTELG